MSMTQESVQAILGSRISISEPGKYKVKVTSVNEYNGRMIVNFNAMTPYHMELTKADINDGNLDECLNHNLSSGQRPGKDFVPEKGTFCNIHVGFVPLKDENGDFTGEDALLVEAVEDVKAVVAKKISFDFFGETAEVEQEADASAM